MKSIFSPLFITSCLLWCVVHLMRWAGQPVPWINDYLTDLLFVPLVAHLSLTFIRRVVVHDRSYTYPLGYLLFISLYTSVIFEYIMPGFSRAYTGDVGDVLAYFGGGVLYYLGQWKRYRHLKSP